MVLRFHLIKHRDVCIKQTDDFVKMRVATLNYDSNIFNTILTLYLSCPYGILLLLFCTVKPPEKQTRTLGLLSTIHAAHIEQNVWILTEEFLNDTDNGLSNLLVTRRSDVVSVGKIKPISRVIGITFIIKRDYIGYIIICFEIQVSIFLHYVIRRMGVDDMYVKGLHLYPLKFIVSRLSGLFLLSLTFSIPFLGFFLASCFYLPSTVQQCKEILTCPLLYIISNIHCHVILISGGKVTNNN